MKFKDKGIREFIDNNKKWKTIKDFEKNVNEMFTLLESLPKEIEIPKMNTPEWANLSVNDPVKANLILHNETVKDVEFVLLITSFKVYHLFKSIIKNLDENKDYEAICLLRVLLENISFLELNKDKIFRIVNKMNSNTKNYLQYQLTSSKLEEIIKKARKGTKIENVVKKGKGNVFAKNILDSIDFVSKKRGYKTIRSKYDILCDYIHPNYFSNYFFGVPTEINEGETCLNKERIVLINGEVELFLRDFPKELSLLKERYLGMIFSIIDMCISLFQKSVKDFNNIKVRKLNAEIPYRNQLLKISEKVRLKMFKESDKEKKNPPK